jgi:hypothetical protein
MADKRARIGRWFHSRVDEVANSLSPHESPRPAASFPHDRNSSTDGRQEHAPDSLCGTRSIGCQPSPNTDPTNSSSNSSNSSSSFKSRFQKMAQGGFNLVYDMGKRGVPPESKIAAEWLGGLVDIMFTNRCRNTTVELFQRKSAGYVRSFVCVYVCLHTLASSSHTNETSFFHAYQGVFSCIPRSVLMTIATVVRT